MKGCKSIAAFFCNFTFKFQRHEKVLFIIQYAIFTKFFASAISSRR